MTYYNIAPALFSVFFKDLNALPTGCFTISNLCLTKIILKSYSINQNCSIVINMSSWSTHEIEVLIWEIEEMQCYA